MRALTSACVFLSEEYFLTKALDLDILLHPEARILPPVEITHPTRILELEFNAAK